jgi:hypothetical protein
MALVKTIQAAELLGASIGALRTKLRKEQYPISAEPRRLRMMSPLGDAGGAHSKGLSLLDDVANCLLTPILHRVAATGGLQPEACHDIRAAVRSSFLLSAMPSCPIGRLHRDMAPTGDKNYDGLAVAMAAIHDGTRLWVVVGSHRLTGAKELNVDQLVLVEIPKGYTLFLLKFLHALTVHAGDDETVSDRVHFYVDPYKDKGRIMKSAPFGTRPENSSGSAEMHFRKGTTPCNFPV